MEYLPTSSNIFHIFKPFIVGKNSIHGEFGINMFPPQFLFGTEARPRHKEFRSTIWAGLWGLECQPGGFLVASTHLKDITSYKTSKYLEDHPS